MSFQPGMEELSSVCKKTQQDVGQQSKDFYAGLHAQNLLQVSAHATSAHIPQRRLMPARGIFGRCWLQRLSGWWQAIRSFSSRYTWHCSCHSCHAKAGPKVAMQAPKSKVACANMYVGVTTFAWARQLGPPWRYMPTSGGSLLLLLTKKRLCPELLDRSASMRAADAEFGIASTCFFFCTVQ